MIFFTGENAQGKTSLLEAVAVASRLGSPRASRQSQIIQEGKAGCGVAIQTDEVLYKAIYQEGKFDLSMDGQGCLRKDYLSSSPKVVWMENRDLEMIRGSGEKRRRFLDAVGSQLSAQYANSLRTYTKALRSRNALLKEGRSGDGSFKAFTGLLLEHGKVLVAYRQQILADLIPLMTDAQEQISGRRESFLMQYSPSSTELERDLAEGMQKDMILKQTQIGPHRDDFSLLVDGRVASDYASEGQQRTLAISLRLAQGELLRRQGRAGELFYLIDDVFGELDETRRRSLLQALPTDCQKVLTTTSLNWGEVSGQVFQVKDGQVGEV